MNWEERSVKAKARDWFMPYIPDIRQMKYLGLPAGQAIFEKNLCSQKEVWQMVLFEKDPTIFREGDKTVKEGIKDGTLPLRTTLVHGSIDRHVQEMEGNPYDVIWLDYCGPVTLERLSTLRAALRMRPKGGVVAVTFMAGREHPNGNTILDFFDESYMGVEVDYEKELVPGYFLRRVKAVGELARGANQYIDIKVLPYKDRVPMMLFVFKDCDGSRPVIEIQPYLKE